MAIGIPSEIDLEELSAQEKLKLSNGIKKAEAELARAKENVIKAEAELARAKEKKESFISFGDREILEKYLSPAKGNHCVIIEGDEAGDFWLEKEALLKCKALEASVQLINAFNALLDEEADFPETALAKEINKILSSIASNKIAKQTIKEE